MDVLLAVVAQFGLYGLLTLGLAVIFAASRVVNLAQADLAMVGAYVAARPRPPRCWRTWASPDPLQYRGSAARSGAGRTGLPPGLDLDTVTRSSLVFEEVVPMAMPLEDTHVTRALQALENSSSSVRLRAAMAVGTAPDPQFVDKLIARCAVEPEFFVRDMLTWALTCHSPAETVPRLIDELGSETAQARSQALHTLSKIGDPRAWPAITRALLTDADDEVARAAWRTAAGLAPEGERAELAGVLATQLGRGERDTQLSLSRALIALGELILPILRAAMTHADARVRQHAIVTERLFHDPKVGFDFAIEEAKRLVALGTIGQEEA